MNKTVKLNASNKKPIEYKQRGNIAFQLLVRSQQLQGDKFNLRQLMVYQLTPVPYSIGLADHFLTKNDKSKGIHYLLFPNPRKCMIIEDGDAVFHCSTYISGTFKGIADALLTFKTAKITCDLQYRHVPGKLSRTVERRRRGCVDK